MELAGLVLGATAAAKLLIKTIKEGREVTQTLLQSAKEARAMAIQFSVATEQTEALRTILFGTSRSADMDGSDRIRSDPISEPSVLMKSLSETTQANIILVVRQLHQAMGSRFQEIQELFSTAQLPAKAQDAQQLTSMAGVPPSVTSRVVWALWKKKRLQVVIEEYESWNEKLFGIVQIHTLAHSIDWPASHNKQPKQDSMKILGLDNDVDLLQISSCQSRAWPKLEIAKAELALKGFVDRLQCGQMDGRDVIIDYKSLPDEPVNSNPSVDMEMAKIRSRILQLGALLRQQRSRRFCTLPCAGVFYDMATPQYGIVFEVPAGRASRPVTLLGLYTQLTESKGARQRPALECRSALALSLAVALSQFHNVGWVHKSVRSQNVIFFPSQSSAETQSNLENPYFIGFEYSREDPGLSEQLRSKINTEHEPYKHPDQWGQPTRRFQKIHDIYALGVVLLEIGLWKPLTDLEGDGFRKIGIEDRWNVQALLLRRAKDQLPFLTGSAYAKVVERCLSGDLTSDQGSSALHGEGEQERYLFQVVEELRRLSVTGLQGS